MTNFTTKDWVLIAVFASLNSVFVSFFSHVNQMLNLVGGPILTSTVVGVYMIYGLLAAYCIRKPGVAAITYLMGGVIQCLIPNAYGFLPSLLAPLCYAVSAEISLFFLRSFSKIQMIIIGATLTPLWYLVACSILGYYTWSAPVLIITGTIRLASGAFLCGLATWRIGKSVYSLLGNKDDSLETRKIGVAIPWRKTQ